MFAYLKTKSEFVEEMKKLGNSKFAEMIRKAITAHTGEIPSKEERLSWKNSLPVMRDVLEDEAIPDSAGIGIEYKFPTMPYRVDFMISGYDGDNKTYLIIIELKQWTAGSVRSVKNLTHTVRAKIGGKWQTVVHPSYQAFSYAYKIYKTNQAATDNNIFFSPRVYMHNYTRSDSDPIFADQYAKCLERAPVFVKGDEKNLREFIKERIVKGDGKEILRKIEEGNVIGCKSLSEGFLRVINDNLEFQLADDQMVVFEEIIHEIDTLIADGKQRVVVVPGGPGTGKSVVAFQLLARYYNAKVNNTPLICVYASKNGAPRNYFINKISETTEENNQILAPSTFQYSGTVAKNKDPQPPFTVVLADEAHRLMYEKFPKDYVGPLDHIKGIMKASLCSVFFIDKKQRISLQDYGTIEKIKELAESKEIGATFIETDELVSQFRCGGSGSYLNWLEHTLQMNETDGNDDTDENENPDLKGVDYDFQVFDSPQALWEAIDEKNKDKNERVVGSRLVAGYCWEWPKKYSNDPSFLDIKNIPGFKDFKKSWNLEKPKDKYYYSYAYDENSINQVGCIHTVQGLDFDYVGVIIGNDMRCENGKIVTDRNERASSDTTLKGIEKEENPDQVADEIIKNTYRVLMSRGLKGCYVFCVDGGLQKYLKDCSKKN